MPKKSQKKVPASICQLNESKNLLLEFFKKAPYPELDLNVERSRDMSRPFLDTFLE